MSTEYTKGPWYADINVYPIMIYSQSEMWPLWDEKGDKEGEHGAWIANTGDSKANARLIAAAPDLLEALTDCVEHMHWTQPQGEAAWKKAKAAIAKATGSEE